jgi:Arc/MetJ family transcription regulator
MKTTIDIPDADLADAMRFTGAKTKREAVVRAMQEFNRLERVRRVCALFGTFESTMTNDEIEAADVAEMQSRNG